jgi:polyhydroxyalkanoate synthase
MFNQFLVYYPDLVAKMSEVYMNSIKLTSFYNSIYLKGFQDTIEDTEGQRQDSFYNRWLKQMDRELDSELRSDTFTSLLARYVDSLVELRSVFRKAGFPVEYLDRMFDSYVHGMMVLSSIPRGYTLTPFDVVHVRGKSRLLHYRRGDETGRKPLLIVYAPINRFYIMDLTPEKSVVRELLSKGLDVYLLDWGYPTWEDDNLSLEDYITYVHDAILLIKEASKSSVSILGYCWGGIIALIYAALYSGDVKSLALMAAPVDFSKDHSILATWARAIDSDKIIDEFRHMDGQVLDLGFIMRNPPGMHLINT